MRCKIQCEVFSLESKKIEFIFRRILSLLRVEYLSSAFIKINCQNEKVRYKMLK